MANTWVLFEESNVNAEGKMDGRFIRRNFEVYSDFETAKQAMREAIRTYALTDGDLFDGAGNVQGIEDLCNLLKSHSIAFEKPGTSEYLDFNDEHSAVIGMIPDLLSKTFLEGEVQDLELPDGVDSTLPVLLKIRVMRSWEELDTDFELGNVTSAEISMERYCAPWQEYKYIDEDARKVKDGQSEYIYAPKPPTPMECDLPPANIEVNSFTMDDPGVSYYCRVIGRYGSFMDAAPFMHVELIALEQQ